MIYSVQWIVLSVMLVLPLGALPGHNSGVQSSYTVRYERLPLWQQSSPFPHWQDTYAVVFAQEMLA